MEEEKKAVTDIFPPSLIIERQQKTHTELERLAYCCLYAKIMRRYCTIHSTQLQYYRFTLLFLILVFFYSNETFTWDTLGFQIIWTWYIRFLWKLDSLLKSLWYSPVPLLFWWTHRRKYLLINNKAFQVVFRQWERIKRNKMGDK